MGELIPMTPTADVLVAFGGYPAGIAGAARRAWRTTERLAGLGHRTTVLTDAEPPEETRPDLPVLASVAKAERRCRAHPPDLVHAYDLARPDHVMAAARLAERHGVPFALTPATAAGAWPDPDRAAAACRAADVVFVLTTAEAAAMEALGVPADRIRHIPQAADLAPADAQARGEAFRARHGLSERTVLFVGQRTSAKGYPVLLEAFSLVRRLVTDAALVLVGPGAEASVPAGVLDLGVVDERTKQDALAACAVLCLPSVADVFPLVFLEAWAAGKPVVSGAFDGVEDVVRHGVDGVVVHSGPEQVASALVELLDDPACRSELGAAGRERVARDCTWDRVADAVAAGYAHVRATGGPEALAA